MGRLSKFKLRGPRLVDAEPVLLRLFVESGSIWVEGWGLMFEVLVT